MDKKKISLKKCVEVARSNNLEIEVCFTVEDECRFLQIKTQHLRRNFFIFIPPTFIMSYDSTLNLRRKYCQPSDLELSEAYLTSVLNDCDIISINSSALFHIKSTDMIDAYIISENPFIKDVSDIEDDGDSEDEDKSKDNEVEKLLSEAKKPIASGGGGSEEGEGEHKSSSEEEDSSSSSEDEDSDAKSKDSDAEKDIEYEQKQTPKKSNNFDKFDKNGVSSSSKKSQLSNEIPSNIEEIALTFGIKCYCCDIKYFINHVEDIESNVAACIYEIDKSERDERISRTEKVVLSLKKLPALFSSNIETLTEMYNQQRSNANKLIKINMKLTQQKNAGDIVQKSDAMIDKLHIDSLKCASQIENYFRLYELAIQKLSIQIKTKEEQ